VIGFQGVSEGGESEKVGKGAGEQVRKGAGGKDSAEFRENNWQAGRRGWRKQMNKPLMCPFECV
jgi:hypothetical protein